MKNYKVACHTHDNFIMPGEIIPLLSKLSENELRVFIYCAYQNEFEISAAAQQTGVSVLEFEKAVLSLAEAGLVQSGEAPAPKAKKTDLIQYYDSETLAFALQTDDFASLKDTVEEMLGKMLNKNDINLLYNIYHFSGLGADYVCTVVAYAVARGKANMRYITRTALSLYDEGVTSFEQLEAYLSEKQKKDELKNRFKVLCGFGARKLSVREEDFINKWFHVFELPFDVVSAAYEKMVDAIGDVRLSYMDKILVDWHAQGVKNEKAAKEAAGSRKGFAAKTIPEDSFDINEFIDAAMKKGTGFDGSPGA